MPCAPWLSTSKYSIGLNMSMMDTHPQNRRKVYASRISPKSGGQSWGSVILMQRHRMRHIRWHVRIDMLPANPKTNTFVIRRIIPPSAKEGPFIYIAKLGMLLAYVTIIVGNGVLT